ncbi:HigA family addiction module antitoxin [Labrys wisconsinensis]|uniref:Addiction module HigA family antidote n=1 Tax=Labrys wisconsinensis TaxID=425677 RepID=A0ABU0JAN5_9HYPH|nr:HigA family addiction module antitoxin [Labrys wisconsinensis]MDQ0471335.1 addiction module HigA family antidote [Labrys wisconsinensis]
MVRLNRNIHPGEILREEFLVPFDLSPYALARAINVPRTRIERIVREETGVTVDTALRLSKFFGTTARFWMNLQASYDLQKAEQESSADIEAIKPLTIAA